MIMQEVTWSTLDFLGRYLRETNSIIINNDLMTASQIPQVKNGK